MRDEPSKRTSGRGVMWITAGLLATGCQGVDDSRDGLEADLLEDEDAVEAFDAPDDRAGPSSPSGAGDLADTPRAQRVLPGFEVTIAVVGDDIALQWDEQAGATYQVWRSTEPYFAIGDVGAVQLSTVAVATFTDALVGSDSSDAYYRVRAVAPDGSLDDSTTVGKRAFPLETGYNDLGLTLLDEIDTAAELVAHVGASAISVHRWDELIQAWIWSWSTDMAPGISFSPGQVVSIAVDASHPPQTVAVGHVPAPEDVVQQLQPGLNIVTLMPWSIEHTTASELLAAVPGATAIGRWDAPAQATQTYAGPGDDDFVLELGQHIKVETEQASSWPVACTDDADCATNLRCSAASQCELDPCVFDLPEVECDLHEVEIQLTADNQWTGTFDGAPFSGPGAELWPEIDTLTFSVPAGEHTFAIQVEDFGAVGGFIAVVSVDGEQVSHTGDGSWTVGAGAAASVCGNLALWGSSPGPLYTQGATWIWDDGACTPFHTPLLELTFEI